MGLINEIRLPIASELEQFERIFKDSMVSSNQLLNVALDHIKKGTGKMMRPMLVLLIAKLYGEIKPETYNAAVSLELLHTASLVHDDVVDESDKRRGQKSINSIFDNKVSVLVGDYLLATSLVQVGRTCNYKIIDVVAKLGQQLSEGEILQLDNISNANFSEEVYYHIISKKTAALFSACARIAALSVNASVLDIENATLFGEYLGICFQIKDDIFDYFSSDIGKPTGNDMLEGKLTLPALFVLNNNASEELIAVGLAIKNKVATTEQIETFVEKVKELGGIDYAISTMVSYKNKALKLIEDLDNPKIKYALSCYLDYIVDRKV